eukprot:762702-Hanusia_phi.AAC.3
MQSEGMDLQKCAVESRLQRPDLFAVTKERAERGKLGQGSGSDGRGSNGQVTQGRGGQAKGWSPRAAQDRTGQSIRAREGGGDWRASESGAGS